MDERSPRRARRADDAGDDGDGVGADDARDDARARARDDAATRAATTRDGARVGNALDAVIERNDLFAHPPSITRDYRVDEALKLRYCAPYDFDFVCGVKARWAGRRLCDLFASEFPMRPKEYYVKAHAMGRLCVEANGCARTNGEETTTKTTNEAREHEDGPMLAGGNRVRHFIHRHEPPVMADEVRVLTVNDDVVSVWKPATVPVHPTGQYRRNTVLALLAASRRDLGRLFPIHRLDKNVSGLLLLARSSEAANEMRVKMEAREMRKEYVARVRGAFNDGDATPVSNVESLGFDSKGRVAIWRGKKGVTDLDERTLKSFKDASTKFTCIKTLVDGTSLVRCEPFTGRSHQIRAHLAMLGYPIANDVAYGGALVEVERARAIQHACDVTVLNEAGELVKDESLAIDYSAPRKSREQSSDLCPHCPRIVHAGDQAIDLEAIWLHCVRYSGEGWEFECPMPDWAL